MKKAYFLLFGLLFINGLVVFGQKKVMPVSQNLDEQGVPTNLYKEVFVDFPIIESSINGDTIRGTNLIAYPGFRFTIVGQLEDDYIVRFWKRQEKRRKDSGFKKIIFSKGDFKVSSDSIMVFLNSINEKKFEKLSEESNGPLDLLTGSSSTPDDPQAKMGNSQYNTKYVTNCKDQDNDPCSNYKYFRVKKREVEFHTKSIVPMNSIFKKFFDFSVSSGTILVPIKIRSNQNIDSGTGFEFSKDVGLGQFIGLKRRISRYHPYFLTLGCTVGISSVSISGRNSKELTVGAVRDISAFTTAFGVVLEIDRVQVGVFLGADRINGQYDVVSQNENGETVIEENGINWDYHGKTWFSVGFGYSLFSNNGDGTEKKVGLDN